MTKRSTAKNTKTMNEEPWKVVPIITTIAKTPAISIEICLYDFTHDPVREETPEEKFSWAQQIVTNARNGIDDAMYDIRILKGVRAAGNTDECRWREESIRIMKGNIAKYKEIYPDIVIVDELLFPLGEMPIRSGDSWVFTSGIVAGSSLD